MRFAMTAVSAGMLLFSAVSSPVASVPIVSRPTPTDPSSTTPSDSDDILQSLQQEALPGLIQSLTEKKTTRRFRVTQMTGDLQGHQASPYLLQSYKEAPNDGVRCKLLESMGKFHDPALLGWYLQRLKDPSVRIQCFAIWALGELRTSRAVEPLRKKLWSPDRFVQMTAIDALGKVGRNFDVATELAVFLTHDDVQVRYLAAKALAGAGGPDVVPTLFLRLDAEPSLDVQEILAQSIGRIGGPVATGHLIELLKNPTSQATEHWAEVGLESTDAGDAIAALQPLLEGSDFRLKVSAARLVKQLQQQGLHEATNP